MNAGFPMEIASSVEETNIAILNARRIKNGCKQRFIIL
jgi:hypothetical protein